ncbi:TetR/AcrR family transcriptional regulator [Planosporangium thailandense]|uniref:TetR/AcrR family transcriptional regulator n=1 Tax=Planosporangium thailandense TaxID=765197 RepID=A0ABX0Y5M1_9ACTN|nr:TetR/AcrR family transcriptional regulator [Planosporangium thailandense]NJC73710.1 TetR/AcrR family transcriptional regulator [Planosporangium thailandense]
MSDDRLERILDAAYACFARHGVRRTTMDDIAAAAGMSRPAVYQYVRNKDDAFRRLAQRLFDGAAAQAAEALAGGGTLTERLTRALDAKLELTLRLWRESPHAAELLGANARVSADLDAAFTTRMRDLLSAAVSGAMAAGEVPGDRLTAQELAELALALTRGLEADLSDPSAPRRRLRAGVALLVAGAAHESEERMT